MSTGRDSAAGELEAKEEERRQVGRAIEGDSDAFAALYERHVSQVYTHLYFMVGQEAEDLTAETFLRAWKSIARYEMRGVPFVSWLLRIAHNQGISYLRAHRETASLPAILPDKSSARDPEAFTDWRLTLARVKEAIAHLSDLQRRVLSLRLMEDEDYLTVASRMGRSVESVRVLQHRGLRNVRSLLSEAA